MSFEQLAVLLAENGFDDKELNGMLNEYRIALSSTRRKKEATRWECMIYGFIFGLEAVGVLTRHGTTELIRSLRTT